MTELIIDACGDVMNVVLTKDGKLMGNSVCAETKRHSVTLLPLTDGLLSAHGVGIDDVDCFCAVVGSGSFTGIRVGIATVKALCYALKKPAKAVTSCAAVAYNDGICGKRIGITDAKQNKMYVQAFNSGVAEAAIIAVERSELPNYLASHAGYTAFTSVPTDISGTIFVADNTMGLINAAGLANIIAGTELSPIYVRDPQALRDLK